jgi:hypothetical protein
LGTICGCHHRYCDVDVLYFLSGKSRRHRYHGEKHETCKLAASGHGVAIDWIPASRHDQSINPLTSRAGCIRTETEIGNTADRKARALLRLISTLAISKHRESYEIFKKIGSDIHHIAFLRWL